MSLRWLTKFTFSTLFDQVLRRIERPQKVKMYIHCLTPIFETTRLLRMKSLGECAQLNYGAPRRRIRLNGFQMKELRNLQNR
ncbi:unnamed protein product [Brassica oleracea]